MQIKSLKLSNFRNHKKAEFEFSKKTLIIGQNGSGKSNLLEAIYLLATGKSFKADRDAEMISYGEVTANVEGTMNNVQLRIFLNSSKLFEVNGVARRLADFSGNLKAVLFGPSDLELITGSPSIRRRYLDFVLSQADREYHRCMISYEKGLRQRNKLLDRIREGVATRSQLYFWDKLLIKNGEYITNKRGEYLNRLNKPFNVENNAPSDPPLNLRGGGGSYGSNEKIIFQINYDKSIISEIRLKQYEVEEVAAATTLVGPHRDDFTVEMNHRDVSKYGSRGEQRMAVMWLKQGELWYLSHFAEASRDAQLPVLLLDDIFSELDHKHREEVETEIEELVNDGGQVIMTTADIHNQPTDKEWNIIEL